MEGREVEDVEEAEGSTEVGGVSGGGVGMAEEEEEVVLCAGEVEGGVGGGAWWRAVAEKGGTRVGIDENGGR